VHRNNVLRFRTNQNARLYNMPSKPGNSLKCVYNKRACNNSQERLSHSNTCNRQERHNKQGLHNRQEHRNNMVAAEDTDNNSSI
jgi:hypothetical protein